MDGAGKREILFCPLIVVLLDSNKYQFALVLQTICRCLSSIEVAEIHDSCER